MIALVDALGGLAGMLNLASTLPQLVRCARAGGQLTGGRDIAQIRGRVLQLASNGLWVAVGVIDDRLGLTVPCGLAVVLLTLLIYILVRGRNATERSG